MKTTLRTDYLQAQLEAAAQMLGCAPETLARVCIAEALPGYLNADAFAEVVSVHPCPDDGPWAWDSAHEREFAQLLNEREQTRATGAEVSDFL